MISDISPSDPLVCFLKIFLLIYTLYYFKFIYWPRIHLYKNIRNNLYDNCSQAIQF